MVISSDCTGSCKTNYHTITTTTAPNVIEIITTHKTRSSSHSITITSSWCIWEKKLHLKNNFCEKSLVFCVLLLLILHVKYCMVQITHLKQNEQDPFSVICQYTYLQTTKLIHVISTLTSPLFIGVPVPSQESEW